MAYRHGFETKCQSCGAKGELRWKESDSPWGPSYEHLIEHKNLIVLDEWSTEPSWKGKIACNECGAVVYESKQ